MNFFRRNIVGVGGGGGHSNNGGGSGSADNLISSSSRKNHDSLYIPDNFGSSLIPSKLSSDFSSTPFDEKGNLARYEYLVFVFSNSCHLK